MDFSNLYAQLKRSITDINHDEVNQLHISFQNLISNLGAAFPEKQTIFNELYLTNHNAMMNVRARHINASDYFTGNGPIAGKLKDTIGIQRWMLGQVTIGSDEATLKDLEQYILDLSKGLSVFDFKPNTDMTKVKELDDTLVGMRAIVDGSRFSKPLPPLTFGTPYLDLKTGIYGDGADSTRLVIVLKATSELYPGLIAYYVSELDRTTPKIYYYHPYELEILMSDGLITFDGIIDSFKEQFTIALDEAGLISEIIDYDAEYKKLVEISNEIFDQEEYLFDRFICDGTGQVFTSAINQRTDWIARYDRGEQASRIEISFPGMILLFANTRGAYPSRHNMLMRNLQTVVKVDRSELSSNTRLLIIQRTNQIFKIVKQVIEFRKNQDSTKILHVEKL